jgi:hypothetical protein
VVALGFACWFVALPERRMPVGRPAFAPTP